VTAAGSRDEWDRHWEALAASASGNPAERMRRRATLRALAVGAGPARVLDIGCGQGDLLADLRGRHPGAELRGLDRSLAGVRIAAAKVPAAAFHHVDLVSGCGPPPALRGWATHAVCSEVLEHVDDPVALLRAARRWLGPGCRLVVTVPAGPMSAFDRGIGHRRHFTVRDLRHTLEAAGLEVGRVTTVGFPFFNLYRLVVVARGSRLAADVSRRGGSPATMPARAAMAAFRPLLRLGLPRSPWSWQLVAVALAPC
jgi:SAM-dependent methyltransferase